MADGKPAASGGFLGGLASLGGGIISSASKAVSSALGYPDLEVVDPDAGEGNGAASGPGPSDEKVALFTSLKQYIGSDISSLVSVPVWIMEPTSTLQKMAEIMEYTDLLDQAAACEDPAMRLALIAAFAVAPYAAAERVWKPFNPTLGETYEMVTDKGVHLVSEQVSHHPPVGVQHAACEAWDYTLVGAPTTKFLGNSIEIYANGRTRLKMEKFAEEYYIVPPTGKAHNLIIGRMWVDTFGEMVIGCPSTGWEARLTFTPCGWFGASRYEVAGHITGPDGAKALKVSGKWNSFLDAVRCGADGEPAEGANVHHLWKATEKPAGDYYGMTHFARAMNRWPDTLECVPMPTDSRRREDRHALDVEDSARAAAAKTQIEERQRADRREREAKQGVWTPKWFRKVEGKEPLPGEPEENVVGFYEFTGDFKPCKREGGVVEADVLGKDFNPWQYDL